jgi:cytochrome c oxidase subunit II
MSHGAATAPAASEHAGHGTAPAATLHDDGDAPVEVYLAAGRFAFEPDDLRLETGRRYRFHMMATDVAHGASIAFGRASRIVRLRPLTVTTLDLTFHEAGKHLVYCTVYCGPGHDGMHGSITVA